MTPNQELVTELQEDLKNLKVMIANFEFDIAHLQGVGEEEPDITLVMANELEKSADSVLSFAKYP